MNSNFYNNRNVIFSKRSLKQTIAFEFFSSIKRPGDLIGDVVLFYLTRKKSNINRRFLLYIENILKDFYENNQDYNPDSHEIEFLEFLSKNHQNLVFKTPINAEIVEYSSVLKNFVDGIKDFETDNEQQDENHS